MAGHDRHYPILATGPRNLLHSKSGVSYFTAYAVVRVACIG